MIPENNQIPERIYKILEGLIAKRDNSGASQAEAESAAQKIQELLLKYNLSLSDVDEFGKKKEPQAGHTYISMDKYQDKNGANWAMQLIWVVAKANLCRAIQTDNYPGVKTCAAILVGQPHNIEFVMYGFEQLVAKIKSAESWGWKQYVGDITNRNTYKRGFYKGCVDGIREKLQAQMEQLSNQQSIEGGQITALVLRNNTLVDDYVSRNFKTRGSGPKRGLSGVDGYRDGVAAGKNMGINKGLGSNSSPALGAGGKP